MKNSRYIYIKPVPDSNDILVLYTYNWFLYACFSLHWPFFVCQSFCLYFPCFTNSHCENDIHITAPCFAAVSPDTWHQEHVQLRELCRPIHRHWRCTEVRTEKPRGLMVLVHFERKLNPCPSLTETHFLIYVQKNLHVQCVRCQIHIRNRRSTKPVTRLKLTSAGNLI